MYPVVLVLLASASPSTESPTSNPTRAPTTGPTSVPTSSPTSVPTVSTTAQPTATTTTTTTVSTVTSSSWSPQPPVGANHSLHYTLMTSCQVTGLPQAATSACNASTTAISNHLFNLFDDGDNYRSYTSPLAHLVMLPFTLAPGECPSVPRSFNGVFGNQRPHSVEEYWNVGLCRQLYGGVFQESQAQCDSGCRLLGNRTQNLLCMALKYPDAGCRGRPTMIGRFVADTAECLSWVSTNLSQVGFRHTVGASSCGRSGSPWTRTWSSTSVAWMHIQPGSSLSVSQIQNWIYPSTTRETPLFSPTPMPLNSGRGRFVYGTTVDEYYYPGQPVSGAVYWQSAPCAVLWRVGGPCGCGKCGCPCDEHYGADTGSLYQINRDRTHYYVPTVCTRVWDGTCNTTDPLSSVTTTLTTTTQTETTTPVTHPPTPTPICERNCSRFSPDNMRGDCRTVFEGQVMCQQRIGRYCGGGYTDCRTNSPTPATPAPTPFPRPVPMSVSCPAEQFPISIEGYACPSFIRAVRTVPYAVDNASECRRACCAWSDCEGYLWCGAGTAWFPYGQCPAWGSRENRCQLVVPGGWNAMRLECGDSGHPTLGALKARPTRSPTVSLSPTDPVLTSRPTPPPVSSAPTSLASNSLAPVTLAPTTVAPTAESAEGAPVTAAPTSLAPTSVTQTTLAPVKPALSPSSASSVRSSSSKTKLSSGADAGIAIGVCFFLAVILIVGLYIYGNQKKSKVIDDATQRSSVHANASYMRLEAYDSAHDVTSSQTYDYASA